MSSLNATAVNWGLTGVCAALTVGRFAIRGHKSRRLYWDDLAHFLALVVLIVHGITNKITNDAKDDLALYTSGKAQISQGALLQKYQHVQYLNTINNCFLYLVFWLVKISFLLLYRTLFGVNARFNKVWWAVLVFTVLTFWVPIAGVIATCANAKTVADYKACDANKTARAIKLEYSCAINVASDIAIMCLPLWQLYYIKIRLSQKAGLGFIFSLAFFAVALDILRTVQAVALNQVLYTILEINFVVIISCLPTYRALLDLGRQRKLSKASKLSTLRSEKERKGTLGSNGVRHPNIYTGSRGEYDAYLLESQEHPSAELENTSRDFIPPENAHVRI